MSTSVLTDRQRNVIAKLQRTRGGVALLAHVWATPSGSWAETQQAEQQAEDALPRGVGFEEAMQAVADAGLAPHIHPDRTYIPSR